MSKYIVVEAGFDALDTLLETLVEFGVPLNKIIKSEKPLPISGYHGVSEGLSANVIIKAGTVGNKYDIGFKKTEKGYIPQVVDMERKCAIADALLGKKFNQIYKKNHSLKTLKKIKHKITSQKIDGNKIKIRISV